MKNYAQEHCGCHLFTDEDGKQFLIVCPMHYGRMLQDSSIDYGLCTNIEVNKELSEKYGVPIVETFVRERKSENSLREKKTPKDIMDEVIKEYNS